MMTTKKRNTHSIAICNFQIMLLRSSSKKMKRQMIVKSIIIIKIGSVLQKMTIHRKKWRVQ